MDNKWKQCYCTWPKLILMSQEILFNSIANICDIKCSHPQYLQVWTLIMLMNVAYAFLITFQSLRLLIDQYSPNHTKKNRNLLVASADGRLKKVTLEAVVLFALTWNKKPPTATKRRYRNPYCHLQFSILCGETSFFCKTRKLGRRWGGEESLVIYSVHKSDERHKI